MFKTRYESSANICRFRGCSRATDGYSTKQLLEEHEGSHTGGIKCAEPSCSFSRIGFKNSAGLKRHTNEFHATPETIKPTVVRRQFPNSQRTSRAQAQNSATMDRNVLIAQKDARFKALAAEVEREFPRNPPIPHPPEVRAQMQQWLRDSYPQLKQLNKCLLFYNLMDNPKPTLKQMIEMVSLI